MNKKNSEGYMDLTAHDAMTRVRKEEKEIEKRSNDLIGTLKLIAYLAGFEFVGRIHIRHRESGKEFR